MARLSGFTLKASLCPDCYLGVWGVCVVVGGVSYAELLCLCSCEHHQEFAVLPEAEASEGFSSLC